MGVRACVHACVCVCRVVAVGSPTRLSDRNCSSRLNVFLFFFCFCFVLQSQAVQTVTLMMTSAPNFLFGPFTYLLTLKTDSFNK